MTSKIPSCVKHSSNVEGKFIASAIRCAYGEMDIIPAFEADVPGSNPGRRIKALRNFKNLVFSA